MDVVYGGLAEEKDIDGRAFPLLIQPQNTEETTKDNTLQWVKKNALHIKQLMLEHGAVLLRGFPVEDAYDFENILENAQFENMPYVGGAAPRQEVTQGRILTANESPPSEPIPFHHEMAQVPNPPAYVCFYCDVPPQVGGATPIVHSHRVYQRFQAISPEFCQRIEEVGVRYVRVMPDQDDASSPIGRSWRSTFQTNDRLEAEARMKAIGTTWKWLDDGNLYTETTTVPAIRTDERTQKKTFFNSMVAAYTGWVDQRNDPKKAVCCGDGTPVDGEVLEATAKAMVEESVAFQWQKGDVLLIDNGLVLHSRQPFEGSRRILASIAIA